MERTMHESAWLNSGGPWGTGCVIRYEVDGLPPGERISIADFGGPHFPSWGVLKIKDDVSSGWKGDYSSAGEAMKEIQ
jgi:hypothetical protein